MTTIAEELETLDPESTSSTFELTTGTEVEIEHLRTRQLLRFLKILTVGAGAALTELKIGEDSEPGELAQELIAILLVSIPDAEDEVMDFMRSMVKPAGLISPEKTKGDRVYNVQKFEALFTELDNPEIEDTIAILEKVIKAEAPNMLALGKRLAALLPASAAKPTTSSKKPTKK